MKVEGLYCTLRAELLWLCDISYPINNEWPVAHSRACSCACLIFISEESSTFKR